MSNLLFEINLEGVIPVVTISEKIKCDRVWFTADSHFMHRNIINLCKRPYACLEDMEVDMVRRWNLIVQDEDLVFYLGDFSMNMLAHKVFFPKLKFGKMFFILGNHERKNKLLDNLSSLNLSEKVLVFQNLIFRYKEKSFFLTHQPINAHADMPSLCGHVHEKWKFMDRGSVINQGAPGTSKFRSITLQAPILNVGVDQFDFYPVNMKTVLEYL